MGLHPAFGLMDSKDEISNLRRRTLKKGKQRRALMKNGRKARGRSSVLVKRRASIVMMRKVRALKVLIPKSTKADQGRGLEGLFRETADYILALQMRVKVMQILVNALTGSSDDAQ